MDMDIEKQAKKEALKKIIRQLQGLIAEEGEMEGESLDMGEGMEAAEDEMMGDEMAAADTAEDIAEDMPEMMSELDDEKKNFFKRTGKVNPGKSKMTIKIAAMGAPKAMKMGKGKYS